MNATALNNTAETRPRGAQPANRNALRHGLRAGRLPSDARYIENRLAKFRVRLEDAVLAARGTVTIIEAATIQTVLRWERHAALAQRWLRLHAAEMTHADRLSFSREVARASSERDRALASLSLDVPPDPWAQVDAPQPGGRRA